MKEVRVIAYASTKLRLCEDKYVTHDLEITTIVHALGIWRHYLVKRKFELNTYLDIYLCKVI